LRISDFGLIGDFRQVDSDLPRSGGSQFVFGLSF
jgi:hypothetical protein